MKNMKRWKRLLAVGMCSAMVFSMPVGVSATENQDTDEIVVETEKKVEVEETVLPNVSGIGISNETVKPQESDKINKEIKESEDTQDKSIEKTTEPKADEAGDVLPIVEPVTIEYVPGKTVEIPVTNGTGKYAIDHVWVSGILVNFSMNGAEYDAEEGVIRFQMQTAPYYEELSEGDYPVSISFFSKQEPNAFHTNEDVKIHLKMVSKSPVLKTTSYITDGSQDLVYRFENGTGEWELAEITAVGFAVEGYPTDGGEMPYLTGRHQFTYDIDNGTVTIKGDAIQSYNRGDTKLTQNWLYLWIEGKTTQGGEIKESTLIGGGFEGDPYGWSFKYEEPEKAEGMPKLISQNYTFDGTQDLVFKFENGTGDYAIKDVIKLSFWSNSLDVENRLDSFWISNVPSGGEYTFSDESGALVTDIENGTVTFADFALSTIVYNSKYKFANPYYGAMFCEFANGETGYVYSDEQGKWSVELLPMSPNAVLRHIETLGEDNKISKERMQELVEINKEKIIVIRTTSGLSYVFNKNDFKIVGNKDEYDFGVILNTDFSKSGIKNSKVTAEDYAEGIEYKYDGELPGKAQISIPVDSKWNGRTLYYYERTSDGTLEDTGEITTVYNGVCKVSQSHCSDYVLLTKAPKEIGVTENTDNDNNQSGTGNTQGTENNTNPQFKPADTTKTSPKTGDNNMILLFVVLCVGSCLVGVSTLKARRRTR